DLLAALVQMIENGKEYILCFLCGYKQMDIIEDQHINQLVKMNEVVDLIIPGMIDKLVDEFLGAYIQHSLIRVQAAHLIADCLYQVRLAPAYPAKDYQRIEGRCPGLLCHMHTGRACYAVTIAFYIIFKNIIGIELRI